MYNPQLLVFLHQAEAKPLWPEGTAGVFTAEIGVPENGVWIKLSLYIKDHIIHEIRYRVIGGGYLIATVEWANVFLTGKPLSAAESLTAKMIVEALALPSQRFYCAQMVVEAIQKIMGQMI